MEQSTTYRGRRDQGWLVLACSVPFLLAGIATTRALGLWAGAFTAFLGACGVVVVAVGLALLRTRVVVGTGGISKAPRFPGGFAILWDTVEAWSVTDLDEEERDTFSRRAVRFTIGGRRVEVREGEVSRPGFDRFLHDVRSRVGGREVAPLENDSHRA